MNSISLVPGDVIIIKPPSSNAACTVTCDAILLSGECVMQEASLTGESLPVTKTSLPQSRSALTTPQFSIQTHAQHVLFAGTQLLQCNPITVGVNQPITALAIRTGNVM